ncbi:MAG TPA: dihydroorotate dehydrogenase electron transfer subunit [Abditibacteriaceae bacterium]|nr:dihydroorotate dehydrogenase electron transfer subunit [Abditibacteriaceae bacterium]
MKIAAPTIARRALPGQFVHILTRSCASNDPLLRRAFSIMAAAGETLEILYRIEGKGTLLMSLWRAGQEIDLLGPLGMPFATGQQRAILVGGGVGIPPLVMLASSRYVDTGNNGQDSHLDSKSTLALLGARSTRELICVEDFSRCRVPVEVATDDGSSGYHGYVTDLLVKHLEQTTGEAVLPTVFACGPLPMLRAVAAICARRQVPCQVSLEESMPCGIGVCNGCVVPVTGARDDYGRYRRICMEGPVLWAHEVDWSHYPYGTGCDKS